MEFENIHRPEVYIMDYDTENEIGSFEVEDEFDDYELISSVIKPISYEEFTNSFEYEIDKF